MDGFMYNVPKECRCDPIRSRVQARCGLAVPTGHNHTRSLLVHSDSGWKMPVLYRALDIMSGRHRLLFQGSLISARGGASCYARLDSHSFSSARCMLMSSSPNVQWTELQLGA